MLDRTIPPKSKEIETIRLPLPTLHVLQNQIPLYVLHMGNHAVTKLELFFKSGNYYEQCPGAAYFTAEMLLKGTRGKNAQAIAHVMDYYGAIIEVQAQADLCYVVLSTLTKHLAPMMDLLLELLLTVNFPKKSLQLLKDIKTHSIQMSDSQVYKVAYKQFCAAIFGPSHPYGRHLTVQEVQAIQLGDLHYHYENIFFSDCCAFVSGQIPPDALQLIKQALEQLQQQKECSIVPIGQGTVGTKIHNDKGKRLQSAIVMGKQLPFQGKDPDFVPMVVLNELLGGYFGSRLMQNVREDKGYTYGIQSRLVVLQKTIYIAITTEVAQEVTKEVVKEINKEIVKLQHTLVPDDELTKVRHYLLGRFLTNMVDPFSIMQRFQTIYLHGLDHDFYTTCYHRVNNMDVVEIRDLAKKYVHLDTLTEVIVG